MGIRTKRDIDKKDTIARVKSWIYSDIVDPAVDIGYRWEVESTTEAIAWAYSTSSIEQGLTSAKNKILFQQVRNELISSSMSVSILNEKDRLLEIAKYKRMAKEYKIKLEKEKEEMRLRNIKDENIMQERIKRAMERGREKELLKLKLLEEKRKMDRSKAENAFKRKQELASQEGNLMKLLRKGARSKIRLGKGIKGLSRQWKKLSKDDKKLFENLGVTKNLGLSPARQKRSNSTTIKDDEKEKEEEKKNNHSDSDEDESKVMKERRKIAEERRRKREKRLKKRQRIKKKIEEKKTQKDDSK